MLPDGCLAGAKLPPRDMKRTMRSNSLSQLAVAFAWKLYALSALTAACTWGCAKGKVTEKHSSGVATAQSAQLRLGPLATILGINSPECAECAAKNCADWIEYCNTVEGVAENGLAKGTPRQKLCMETLECTLKSRCVTKTTAAYCYCGTANGAACLTGTNANGTCKRKIEDGLETTDPAKIGVLYNDGHYGAGAALALDQCLVVHHCEQCF